MEGYWKNTKPLLKSAYKEILVSMFIPVYNTCTLLWNKEKYVDANLDASDNAISDNESSSEMLTSQSQIPEWAKSQLQVMPKSEDLSN